MRLLGDKKLAQAQKSRTRALLGAFVLACLLNFILTSVALANSLRNAKNAFVQGDLPGVVKLLEPEIASKPRLKGKELEDARGLYGIAQFMLGNKNRAEFAFKLMIKANPSAKLDKKYLLDPAAEPLFNSLKKGSAGGAKASAAPATGPQSTRTGGDLLTSKSSGRRGERPNGRPTPPPENPRPESEPQRPIKKGPFTGIQVKVNAPRATLFADGIFIGSPDQNISLEPGKHVISVSAEGYVTEEKSVRVDPGKTLQLTMTLKKEGSAARVTEKQKPLAPSAQKKNPKSGGLASNQPKRSLNFNQDLPAVNAPRRSKKSYADQYFQEPAQPQPQYSQPPQQYSQPPQYSSPPPQQAYPPNYQQPYPPAYQQPYAPAPQPQYSYPPPVYAPPPVYTQPDPYAQPPAYAAPPPSYGAPNPYEEDEEAGDIDAPSSRSSGRSRGRKKSRPPGSAALAILPFGVGQFQNGDSGKGMLFLISEAGAIGTGVYFKMKAGSDEKKLATQRDEMISGDPAATQEELDQFDQETQVYISKLNSYFTYSLIGAGALYAIGVIDAFVNLETKSSSRKRRNRDSYNPEDKKFDLALGPTLDGGMKLKFTLKLD